MSASVIASDDSAPSTSRLSTDSPRVEATSDAVNPVAAANVVPSKARSRSWSVNPITVASARVTRQHQASVVAPVSR